MQRPVAKSLLPSADEPLRWPRIVGGGGGFPPKNPDPAAESGPDSSSSLPAVGLDFFFLPEKSDGNGWLMERVWRGRGGWLRGWISSSDELESPCWRWWFCMLSQTSISETREVLLYRPCEGACAVVGGACRGGGCWLLMLGVGTASAGRREPPLSGHTIVVVRCLVMRPGG